MPTFRDDLHLGHSVPMVDTEDIVDGAVTEPKLADDSVSTRTIQDGAVTEPKIAEKAVTEPKLADAAVSTRTIKFRAVTESKIGDSAVSTRTIQNGAVTNPKIANGAVSMNKLDNETQTLIQRGADSSWTPMGDYDVDALYYANDLVFDPETNSSYLSLRADNMGHAVTDEEWWMKVLDGSYVNLLEEELQQLVDSISDGTQQQVEELNEALEALEAQADQSRQDIQDIVNSLAVVQTTGQSASDVMSQKAVTDEIIIPVNYNHILWHQSSLGTNYLPDTGLNKARNSAIIEVVGMNKVTLDGSADDIYVNCYLLDANKNVIASYDNPWATTREIPIGNAVYMSMACKKGSAGTATLNVGDNTLVVIGYKGVNTNSQQNDQSIKQLGAECKNIVSTTEEVVGAIGSWNASTGAIGTTAATRAHLRISACNVNKMTIVVPTPYYASFFYVGADNISQGQVGNDMGTGEQVLELSGEYDLMAIIKYKAAGTTKITATMLNAAPFHIITESQDGYEPAAPFADVQEISQQVFQQMQDVVNLDGLDYQMRTYDGQRYIVATNRVAAMLSNDFGENAVINADFTAGKMMFHFWHAADAKNATIYSLNTTTDTYIGETGWTETSAVTQVPEDCNVIVLLFDATSVTQARTLVTSVAITSNVAIANRVGKLEGKVANIESNDVLSLCAMYRSIKIPNDADTQVVVMENGDKITHDATHIVKDGKVYVVYCANSHDTGDSGEFSNYAVVRLDIYDVSNGIDNATLQSRQIIGGNGYAVGGSTISGGAGVPNAYLVGNIIHIIFGAKIGSTWTEIHCTYDTSNSTLGSLEQCTMDSSPLTGAVLATHSSLANSFNYQLSFNASIAEIAVSGTTYYYACICSAARIANSLIVRTTNFKDWEFVVEPNFVGCAAQYEGAMGALNGYIYLALRQNVSGMAYNGMLLAKLNNDGSVVEYRYMAACNSRPAFYNQDGKLFVIIPSGTRANATIYNVNDGIYELSEIATIAGDTNTFGQYLEVVPTSPQYVTYTTNKGYSYSYVRLFATDVIASNNNVLDIILRKLL